jgi:choline kinase
MLTNNKGHKNDHINTALILAAGMGVRLKDVISDRPKGFLKIDTFPIIERSVMQLQSIGIDDIIIVTGFESKYYETLAKRFNGIRIVNNKNYARSGSMYSFWCAKELLSGSFLLLESDIVYETRALERLVATHKSNAILTSGPTSAGDEVWVEMRDGRVSSLSKHIAHHKNAKDLSSVPNEMVGISKISPKLLKVMFEYAESYFNQFDWNLNYEDCISTIAQKMDVFSCNIGDLLWGEIDDHSQFKRVQAEVLPKILEKENNYIAPVTAIIGDYLAKYSVNKSERDSVKITESSPIEVVEIIDAG